MGAWLCWYLLSRLRLIQDLHILQYAIQLPVSTGCYHGGCSLCLFFILWRSLLRWANMRRTHFRGYKFGWSEFWGPQLRRGSRRSHISRLRSFPNQFITQLCFSGVSDIDFLDILAFSIGRIQSFLNLVDHFRGEIFAPEIPLYSMQWTRVVLFLIGHQSHGLQLCHELQRC